MPRRPPVSLEPYVHPPQGSGGRWRTLVPRRGTAGGVGRPHYPASLEGPEGFGLSTAPSVFVIVRTSGDRAGRCCPVHLGFRGSRSSPRPLPHVPRTTIRRPLCKRLGVGFSQSPLWPASGSQDRRPCHNGGGPGGGGRSRPKLGDWGPKEAAPAFACPPRVSRGLGGPPPRTAGPLCLQYVIPPDPGAVLGLVPAEVIGGTGPARISLGTGPW